jgi:50S ribosomal subunit-associated GTPase HflX
VVREVLAGIFEGTVPRPPLLYALNKMDLLQTPADWARAEEILGEAQPGVLISAKSGENLGELRKRISELLPQKSASFTASRYD